jgi:hypothetical protein
MKVFELEFMRLWLEAEGLIEGIEFFGVQSKLQEVNARRWEYAISRNKCIEFDMYNDKYKGDVCHICEVTDLANGTRRRNDIEILVVNDFIKNVYQKVGDVK